MWDALGVRNVILPDPDARIREITVYSCPVPVTLVCILMLSQVCHLFLPTRLKKAEEGGRGEKIRSIATLPGK